MERWIQLVREPDEVLIVKQQMPSALVTDEDGVKYSITTLRANGWQILKSARSLNALANK